MRHEERYVGAALAAQDIVSKQGITSLPVDPIALAHSHGIEVQAKSGTSKGVSGMLLRMGNAFGIMYATHIRSIGFRHFSVAHELGHYFLPGHVEAVLADDEVHFSSAGFATRDRYELEADHFAANLLMPRRFFKEAMRSAGDGLEAIIALAEQCQTSLTATAIQYAKLSREPTAIVLSKGDQVSYCFMSDSLKDAEGLEWIRKDEKLHRDTATFKFNQEANGVVGNSRIDSTSDIQDWFGGRHRFDITEQVIGLGSYGMTLTVLTAGDLDEQLEEIEEESALVESWTPRLRK